MTALAAQRQGATRLFKYLTLPLGPNVKAWKGGAASVDMFHSPGTIVPATWLDASLVPIGRFNENIDNTGGAAGAKLVTVELFNEVSAVLFNNDPGLGAVTAAYLIQHCYYLDDQTVSLFNYGPKAGRIWGIAEFGEVIVEPYIGEFNDPFRHTPTLYGDPTLAGIVPP